MKNILVTGGAGYIGSHTVLELLENDFNVTVIDNLVNCKEESLKRVSTLTSKKISFHKIDLRNTKKLNKLFENNKFDAVIHFAGLKSVGESVLKPLLYYGNNLVSTINLLETMTKYKVFNLIFSSSATVYDPSSTSPINEDSKLGPINPYGRTKLMIEEMLKDLSNSDNNWRITSLRYFNPIGAHESGEIGEDPNGVPNNLLPYISQVAIGKLDKLSVYGDDYNTPDGTGIRDYIHVVDLAKAHLAALIKIKNSTTYKTYNIGTGRGTSVMELVKAFEKASERKIEYKVMGRRQGDIAICYANVKLADKELGWHSDKNIDKACIDTWRWQTKNPDGY
jgi:UDP-glucose 4-epimerase